MSIHFFNDRFEIVFVKISFTIITSLYTGDSGDSLTSTIKFNILPQVWKQPWPGCMCLYLELPANEEYVAFLTGLDFGNF